MIKLKEGVVEINGESGSVTAELACFLATAAEELPILLLVSHAFYDIFCPESPLTDGQKEMIFTAIKMAYESKIKVEDLSDACELPS